MIRVMVADDSDIARGGMRRILERESDLDIVCEGTTKAETVEMALFHKPDILLLDLMWFGDEAAGIDVIQRLIDELPDTQIVAITVYPHLMERARAAGARSAVSKNIPQRQLIEELRSIHRVPPSARPPLPGDDDAPDLRESLTERELEVLSLVAEGMTDREVAQVLSIATSTAKNHVSNILQKLDASNRTAAVTIAYRQNLIKPSVDEF